MAAQIPGDKTSTVPEDQIAAVLDHQFGRGLARLPRKRTGQLMTLARQHGFIDAEGYLTRKGRALLARYH